MPAPRMSGGSILNADMATIGRWLRAGLAWWLAELGALLPRALHARNRPARLIGLHSGTGPLTVLRDGLPAAWPVRDRPRPLALAVPATGALVRELEMPAMRPAEARQMAMLEADRLFPLPAPMMIVDARIVAAGSDRRAIVAIAGLPRATAEAALAAAEAAGAAPSALGLARDPAARRIDFDFTPALRAEGLLPPRDAAPAIWWSIVLFAFLLNIGVLVMRDRASVDRLAQLVDAQAPAVAVGQGMLRRIGTVERLARASRAQRLRHAPLRDLAATSAALGDGAWVQRLTWDGGSIRLAGYHQPSVDVLAALRRSPRFANVRRSTADVTAGIAIGQPFDVTADIAGTRR